MVKEPKYSDLPKPICDWATQKNVQQLYFADWIGETINVVLFDRRMLEAYEAIDGQYRDDSDHLDRYIIIGMIETLYHSIGKYSQYLAYKRLSALDLQPIRKVKKTLKSSALKHNVFLAKRASDLSDELEKLEADISNEISFRKVDFERSSLGGFHEVKGISKGGKPIHGKVHDIPNPNSKIFSRKYKTVDGFGAYLVRALSHFLHFRTEHRHYAHIGTIVDIVTQSSGKYDEELVRKLAAPVIKLYGDKPKRKIRAK